MSGFAMDAPATIPGLLDTGTLGCGLPGSSAIAMDDPATIANRPFACAVRILVRGQSASDALEQGSAIVAEVQNAFARGPVAVSKRQGANSRTLVMWENIGKASIRLDPAKSNRINWLDKSWASRALLDTPASAWSQQQELLSRHLPHAASWVRVLQLAYEDGGMDIKDDCRLDDGSARCHQWP